MGRCKASRWRFGRGSDGCSPGRCGSIAECGSRTWARRWHGMRCGPARARRSSSGMAFGRSSAVGELSSLLFGGGLPLLVAFLLVYANGLFYGVGLSLGEVGLLLSRFGILGVAVVFHDWER